MTCNLCPNNCNIDRKLNSGACNAPETLKIAKYYLHPFEEPMISGQKGSGTIFFCGCSLKCVFCQNYEISRSLRGKEISISEFIDIVKELEAMGASNINLVTPTHYTNKLIEAFSIYRPSIPVVYNTHAYENLEVIKKLDKYIDIYLPDIKYFSPQVSARYTKKPDYFEKASKIIEFMANKPLIFREDGLMKSGTIVRHLVLPQNTSDSIKILEWFNGIKDKAYINIMSQYTPFGDIALFPELNRRLTKREYDKVIDYAISLDIKNALYQRFDSVGTEYIPKWDY